ncbi:molybdopterin biosynthesis protein [Spirochaetia bacterium]|nr:molybdopterin biosynthesis protein [Spirochaetia bacterium]
MKKAAVEDAVGQILCHDMTQIVPEKSKGARFRKGHIVQKEDIPVLLSMGKSHIYIWEQEAGMLHEEEAARRLAALCKNDGMKESEVVEGKIELSAEHDGLFRIDLERFYKVNSIQDIIIAARHSLSPVKAGGKLAGMRVIPLVIQEEIILKAEEAAGLGTKPLFELLPYKLKTAGLLITGSEVAKGIIEDAFTPLLTERLAEFGISIEKRLTAADGTENVLSGINELRRSKPDIIICTGGMSVDPDDNTPGAIKRSGAEVITHGAPLLPGSMFMLAYFDDGTPIMGIPGGMLFKKKHAGIFDVVMPRLAARVRMTKTDFVHLSNGGLCLSCPECHYPICPYGL